MSQIGRASCRERVFRRVLFRSSNYDNDINYDNNNNTDNSNEKLTRDKKNKFILKRVYKKFH